VVSCCSLFKFALTSTPFPRLCTQVQSCVAARLRALECDRPLRAQSAVANWARGPEDPIRAILSLAVAPSDVVACSAVCSSWNALVIPGEAAMRVVDQSARHYFCDVALLSALQSLRQLPARPGGASRSSGFSARQ
jgi:hypothetical protein